MLDPFAGSGTTGAAAALEAFTFIGIERDPAYVEIARRRIAYWSSIHPDIDAAPVLDRMQHTVEKPTLAGDDY